MDHCGQNQSRDFEPHLNVGQACIDLIVPILTYHSERTANPLKHVLTRLLETTAIVHRPLTLAIESLTSSFGDHHPPDLQRYSSLRSTILVI